MEAAPVNTLSESCHALIPEGDEWVSASLNSFSCITLRSPEYQTQRGTARIREDDPFGEIGYGNKCPQLICV